jgi:mono/diheme cytochrome c family protein
MRWIGFLIALAGCPNDGKATGDTAPSETGTPPDPGTTSTGPARVATILALTPDVAEGQAKFEQICAACHGLDGMGVAPNPALTKRVPKLTKDQVVTTVLEGKGNMDAYRSLKNQEIANTVEYVYTSFGGAL